MASPSATSVETSTSATETEQVNSKVSPADPSETSVAVDLPDFLKDKISDHKLNTKVRCERCSSLVASPGSAVYAPTTGHNLPFHRKKREGQKPEDEEPVPHCWLLDNMYKFDNVGFSKTVNTTKYLVCADCELGPIGWHDTTVKDQFYLAADRVKYD